VTEVAKALTAITTVTGFIILGLLVVIVVIDSFLALRYGAPATISDVLIKWSRDYPIIPFIFGFFMGHLFFSGHNVTITP